MLTGSLPQAVRTRPRARRAQDARAPRAADGQGRGRRWVPAKSDVDDGAGQRAGDAVEVLHLGDHQLAELVDVAGLGPHDHVVGAGDVLGEGHALDLRNGGCDLCGLADIGLDQDVRLDDHRALPGVAGYVLGQPTARSARVGRWPWLARVRHLVGWVPWPLLPRSR